jgi:ComF family protein
MTKLFCDARRRFDPQAALLIATASGGWTMAALEPVAQGEVPPQRKRSALRRALAACADTIVPPCCLPFDTGERTISAGAAANPPAYGRARAVAHFSGAMRTLVHQLKYADRHDARTLFGRWLAEAGRELQPGVDVIVPVPLSRLRLLLRHFNQAAVLAAELSRQTGVPMDPMLLKRTRWTRSQVGMTRDQRRRNIAGAFGVPRHRRARLEGRNVLLVDDVVTTGATVDACARTLRRAGAARVDVLALALVTNETLAAA